MEILKNLQRAMLIAVLLAGLSAQAQEAIPDLAPEPILEVGKPSATLNAGDLVFINVHRQPELSTTTQLDGNGNKL